MKAFVIVCVKEWTTEVKVESGLELAWLAGRRGEKDETTTADGQY
jgi:hypothetical protein